VVLRTEVLDLLGLDGHVLPLGVLVRGDDLVLGHLAVDRADLLVPDAAVALLVQEVEADLAPTADGRAIRLDGNRNQVELQESFPTGSRRHSRRLLPEPVAGQTLTELNVDFANVIPACGAPNCEGSNASGSGLQL